LQLLLTFLIKETIREGGFTVPDYTNCPYCQEKILSGSKQCEHCDSFLSEGVRPEKPGEKKSRLEKNGEQSQPERGSDLETDLSAPVAYSAAPGIDKAVTKKSNFRLIAVAVLVAVFVVTGSFVFTYYLIFDEKTDITAEENATIVDETGEQDTHDVPVDTINDAGDQEKDREDNGIEESPEVQVQEPEAASEPVAEPEKESSQESAPADQAVNDDEGKPVRGTIEWDGGTYTGTLVNGVPHGRGTWSDATRKSYTGEFTEGNITGYGTMIFPGGAMYTGYFKDGKGHGEGTMTHLDGRSVSGTWIEGVYQEE